MNSYEIYDLVIQTASQIENKSQAELKEMLANNHPRVLQLIKDLIFCVVTDETRPNAVRH